MLNGDVFGVGVLVMVPVMAFPAPFVKPENVMTKVSPGNTSTPKLAVVKDTLAG
jgi:hypothetical protein